MSTLSIILIAFGLAMDAFAVSITSGIVIKDLQKKHALKIACCFGFFQALMPLLGWLAGLKFRKYIENFDHWIAFILLLLIGGKMLYEAIKNDDEKEDFNPLNNKVLLMLAIATSIDALAVGVSFAFLKVSITYAIAIIGLITLILCFAGVCIGKRCGELLKRKAEIAGGVVLIFIGFKILLEHLNIIATFNPFN